MTAWPDAEAVPGVRHQRHELLMLCQWWPSRWGTPSREEWELARGRGVWREHAPRPSQLATGELTPTWPQGATTPQFQTVSPDLNPETVGAVGGGPLPRGHREQG